MRFRVVADIIIHIDAYFILICNFLVNFVDTITISMTSIQVDTEKEEGTDKTACEMSAVEKRMMSVVSRTNQRMRSNSVIIMTN